MEAGEPRTEQELREQAVARLKKKREFRSHLLSYLAINAMLVAIWAIAGGGFFWPIFPILGWALFGLIPHAYEVYFRKPLSEDEINREMQRLRQ
jgi:hypothetical protein